MGQRFQGGLGLGLVALFSQALELVDLGGAHLGVVDLQDVDRLFAFRLELVDADHGLRTAVNARLCLGGRFLDPQLRNALLDGLRHAAKLFHFADVRHGLLRKVCRQLLDVIGTAPGVDHLRRAAFLLQKQLRVAGDTCGEVGRQSQRLVQRIRVQRLRMPLRCRHGFHTGSNDVVEDVLCRQ